MIEIHPDTYRALEQDVARSQFFDFAQWWRARGLPATPDDQLHRLWVHAGEQARELGIEDDEQGRVSLYAVAFRLMGELDGIQFLRVSDVLFESGTRDARLPLIAAIAREPAQAPPHG